jgi:ACT domain-containing protein
MKAIVSVFSKDRIGIIADVSTLLASMQVNILDLTQTIMNGFFTMVMLVDTSTTDKTFDEVRTVLEDEGKKLSLDIRIQREDIFDAMHRI